MESRLADADDRAVEYGARGIETGIVKAGEDCRISIGPLLELDQKAGNREGLVIVALDRGRPVRGRNGRDATCPAPPPLQPLARSLPSWSAWCSG